MSCSQLLKVKRTQTVIECALFLVIRTVISSVLLSSVWLYKPRMEEQLSIKFPCSLMWKLGTVVFNAKEKFAIISCKGTVHIRTGH